MFIGGLAKLVETPTRILRYSSSKLGDGKKSIQKFYQSPLNISELNFLKCEIENDEPGRLVVGLIAKL